MSDVPERAAVSLLFFAGTEEFAWRLFSVARQQALRHRISRDDADDCAMEFVLHLLADQRSVFTAVWLHCCAANHAKNYRRDQVRRQAKHLPWPDLVWSGEINEPGTHGEFTASEPSPEECLLRSELRSRLRTLLLSLQPVSRQLFLRHHLGGESYPDLANAIGKTPDAVRMIVSRAEACLLRLLSRQEATEANLHEYLPPLSARRADRTL